MGTPVRALPPPLATPGLLAALLPAALVPAALPPPDPGPASAPVQEPAATGLWLIEAETAVIRIERCDEGICGAVHWIAEGGPVRDEQNPDPELRSRPLCGLRILEGFERNPDDATEWGGGELYAADEGSTYRGRIRVAGADRLDLRGYVGIPLFGRSQTWVRVSEEDFPACEPPSSGRLRTVEAPPGPGIPSSRRRSAPAG
jgi:uncharacterized protein (DUF2147 family)